MEIMFPGLDADAHRRIAAVIHYPIHVDRGEHLVRSGDRFHDLYSVHDGVFKAYVDDANGREHVWGFNVQGELMGLHAITTGHYQANFVALEPSRVAAIPYSQLLTLLDQIPPLFDFLMRAASGRLGILERLSGDHAAQVRMAAFLVSLPRRFQRLTHAPGTFRLPMSRRDVANYLRLVPETVSRMFSRFVREGLIRVDGQDITLLQLARLEEIGKPLGEL